MIIWIVLQLRDRIFEPLGTDLTAHFVHFHRDLFVFCFCVVFWCCRSLWTRGWNTNNNSGCPEDEQLHIKALGLCLQPGGNGRGKSWMGGKIPHSWGTSAQVKGHGGLVGSQCLECWGINSLSYLQGKGPSPRCCFKGQQLHSTFDELEEIVELGKADCRHCFSLICRIISSDYFFLVHFPLDCPDRCRSK